MVAAVTAADLVAGARALIEPLNGRNLFEAAPALRDTVAALADLADALARRIEALEAALAECADDLEGYIHDGYDGVWSEADIQSEVAPYRAALQADEAAK